MNDELQPEARSKPSDFVYGFKGKKVIIRLISGGQPVTGVIKAASVYEILIDTPKGQMLVFKHAIATLEPVEEPHGYKLD